jgi:parallel beta-helix repeat protein
LKKLALSILVVCAASPGAALGATYYVSKSGNDGNSCAQAQSPSGSKQSIASGLDCLTAGDTLLVRAGIYDESIHNTVPSGTSWGAVTRIAAYSGEKVTLAPTSGIAALYLGGDVGPVVHPKYIEFDGINLDTSAQPTSISPVLLDNRNGSTIDHIRVKNADLHFNETVGQIGQAVWVSPGATFNEFINLTVHGQGGYGFYLSGDSNLIDGCTIYHNNMTAIHVYSTSHTPTGNIVRNNTIYDLTIAYFNVDRPDTRIWGMLVSGDNNQIYNNVIYGINFAYQGSNAGIFVYTGSGHKIYNNTIANNTTDGIYISSGVSNVEVSDNIAYGNTGASFTDAGSGNVQTKNLFGVDPRFVNPAAGNYQLQAGSPAIDAGTASSIAQTDFAGTVRPQGSAIDIGAFEYSSATPPTAPQSVRVLP